MRFLLSFIILTTSFYACSPFKKAEFFDDFKRSQTNYSWSLLSTEDKLNRIETLSKIHNWRKVLFEKQIRKINLAYGIIYTLDSWGGSYSSANGFGNFWTDDVNLYYKFDFFLNTFDSTLFIEEIPVSEWFILKRAIMEWDIIQIQRYNEEVKYTEPVIFVASKIYIKNGKISKIQTYSWKS